MMEMCCRQWTGRQNSVSQKMIYFLRGFETKKKNGTMSHSKLSSSSWNLRNVPAKAVGIHAVLDCTQVPYDCVNSQEKRKRFEAFLKWASDGNGRGRRDFLRSLISWLIGKVLKKEEEELKSKQAQRQRTNKHKMKQRKLAHLLGPDGKPVVDAELQRVVRLSSKGNPSEIYVVLQWFLDNHPDLLKSETLAAYWQYYDIKKTNRKKPNKKKSATKTACSLSEELKQCSGHESRERKVSDENNMLVAPSIPSRQNLFQIDEALLPVPSSVLTSVLKKRKLSIAHIIS